VVTSGTSGKDPTMSVAELTETLLPGPAEKFAALLEVPDPTWSGGKGLPMLWHWLYLLPKPRQSDLGPDGHPTAHAIPVAPRPGMRRMYAGGRVRVLAELRVEEPATRVSQVVRSVEKAGRNGTFTLVTVSHTIRQRGDDVVVEEQDLVYLDGGSRPTGALPSGAGPVPRGSWAVAADVTLLFRFSALTYNAHRVHYDRDYARDVEGYPGLLVHGPLQAMAMAEHTRSARGLAGRGEAGWSMEYRLLAPLFDNQGMYVSSAAVEGGLSANVWDGTGRRTATATFRQFR
jgi:3-methylfumaryl-CoA hydratase